jgi:hypothetical protein
MVFILNDQERVKKYKEQPKEGVVYKVLDATMYTDSSDQITNDVIDDSGNLVTIGDAVILVKNLNSYTEIKSLTIKGTTAASGDIVLVYTDTGETVTNYVTKALVKLATGNVIPTTESNVLGLGIDPTTTTHDTKLIKNINLGELSAYYEQLRPISLAYKKAQATTATASQAPNFIYKVELTQDL